MFAEVNGITMRYEDHGEGEPILLVGGFGAGAEFWDHAASLLDGFRVITYDNRGVGETVYSGDFSIDDMADDAVALMDFLGIDRAHVVGWSMGSHIGQSLGIRHGDRLKSLTLVSTYARSPARSEYILGGVNDMVLRGEVPIECLAMVVNSFCFPEETFREFRDRGRTFPIPKKAQRPEGLRDQLRAVGDYDTSDTVGSITVPTMVVHGGKDIMVEPSEGMAVADSIRGSRFLLLESAGHNIQFELYVGALKEFVSSHS